MTVIFVARENPPNQKTIDNGLQNVSDYSTAICVLLASPKSEVYNLFKIVKGYSAAGRQRKSTIFIFIL